METKKGVIILGGFIQALSLVRSLAELKIPIYVAENKKCIAGFSRYCRKFLISPDSDSPELTNFLIDVAKKYKLSGWLLIPTNDFLVENLSQNKNALQKYYNFIVPSQDELYRIINKRNLLEAAENCGTNIPNTCYIDCIEKAKNFRYPLLIKGNYGCSFFQIMHKKAYEVSSYTELTKTLDIITQSINTHDLMIQELIPSRKKDHVVSFTCFADNGEIRSFWMGQKLRERPIDNGTATFAESIFLKELLLQATPLMKTLSYTGVCEIEFLYDHRDNKWKLIEINPRTWKWVGLAKACGIDYAKMLYLYVNKEAQKYPSTYRVGIKWIDYFTDPIVGMRLIMAKRISIKDYLLSLKGTVIPAIWNWKDPLPVFYFPIYSIKCKLNRLLQLK